MNIKNNNWTLEIQYEKTVVYFDTNAKTITINNLPVSFPGEYEKWWVLLEVKEYGDELFYNFSIDGKSIVIITNDNFEQKEEILSFFWDVDVLIITGSKASAKIFENIEARVVIPYGEWKDIFLHTLWQDKVEEIENFKIKSELPTDNSEFINLA